MSSIDAPHQHALVVSTTMKTADDRLIELRLFDLDRIEVGEIESLESERESASRFQFAHDSSRYLVRRSILRSLLGELHEIAPRDIRILRPREGRPTLEGLPGFHFNASRSGSWFIVASSREVVPGVDIEVNRSLSNIASLIRRISTPGEQQQITEVDSVTSEWFLRIWTRKEAAVKALGLGLALDPSQVGVPVENQLLTTWWPCDLGSRQDLPKIDLADPDGMPIDLRCAVAVLGA